MLLIFSNLNHNRFIISNRWLFIYLVVTLFSGSPVKSQNTRNPYNLHLVSDIKEYKTQVMFDSTQELLNIESINNIVLDIYYATANNFAREIIYPKAVAYARRPVVNALQQVQDSLAKHGLGLKIFDSYRPYSATLRFYEIYPDSNFVANPRKGSRHNRGCAVDVTLIELETGLEIPMPTNFDDFSEKANPQYSELPKNIIANRQFLFSVMKKFGFTYLPTEWWHFDFVGWEKFPLMDLQFEELEH